MWNVIQSFDGLPQPWSMIPFLGFLFWPLYLGIGALALVWNWDWASVDDSTIVPEAVIKPKTEGDAGDGAALIGG